MEQVQDFESIVFLATQIATAVTTFIGATVGGKRSVRLTILVALLVCISIAGNSLLHSRQNADESYQTDLLERTHDSVQSLSSVVVATAPSTKANEKIRNAAVKLMRENGAMARTYFETENALVMTFSSLKNEPADRFICVMKKDVSSICEMERFSGTFVEENLKRYLSCNRPFCEQFGFNISYEALAETLCAYGSIITHDYCGWGLSDDCDLMQIRLENDSLIIEIEGAELQYLSEMSRLDLQQFMIKRLAEHGSVKLDQWQ